MKKQSKQTENGTNTELWEPWQDPYKTIPVTKDEFSLITCGIQIIIGDYQDTLKHLPDNDLCQRQIKRYTDLLNKLKNL